MSRNNNRGRGEARESASRTNGTIRCAIYTRKSTDEGLEQEFNSLDAQRESAEAYRLLTGWRGFTLAVPASTAAFWYRSRSTEVSSTLGSMWWGIAGLGASKS